MIVRFISHTPKLPTRYTISVRRSDTVETLLNYLSERCSVPVHVLVLADLHRHRIFEPERLLSTIRDSGGLV